MAHLWVLSLWLVNFAGAFQGVRWHSLTSGSDSLSPPEVPLLLAWWQPHAHSVQVQLFFLSIPLCSCNAWRDRSSPNSLIPPPISHLQWTQKKNIHFLQDHPLKPSRMWRISQCSLQKKSPPLRGPPQSTFAETSNSLFSSLSNLTVQCLQNNQLAPLQLRGRNWFPITFSFLLSSCTLLAG